MRPLATIIADSLAGYGKDAQGGRVHDLLGTRCDPYIRAVLTQDTETQRADTGEAQVEKGGEYNYHCHSNLVRAILPWGLNEGDVHDVLNLFQVTGLDERGRYWMGKCPAGEEDFLELFAEQDLLMALSKFFSLLSLRFFFFFGGGGGFPVVHLSQDEISSIFSELHVKLQCLVLGIPSETPRPL